MYFIETFLNVYSRKYNKDNVVHFRELMQKQSTKNEHYIIIEKQNIYVSESKKDAKDGYFTEFGK